MMPLMTFFLRAEDIRKAFLWHSHVVNPAGSTDEGCGKNFLHVIMLHGISPKIVRIHTVQAKEGAEG
jgi:hypothetical protein